MSEPLINSKALRELHSLMGGGLMELLTEFSKQSDDCLLQLKDLLLDDTTALSQENLRIINQKAHQLKGSALSLHCHAVVDCCEAMERISTTTAPNQRLQRFQLLESVLKATNLNLANWQVEL